MNYNWKKALANAAMIFIGCFIAKFPAGDSVTLNWQEVRHVLVYCGSITLFAELRYIYAALQKYIGG